jgi:hypothetical protein
VARSLPGEEVADPDLAFALTQGKRAAAFGREGAYALTHRGALLGIFADREGQARSELVWTRPEEFEAAVPRGAASPEDGAPSTSSSSPTDREGQ